MSNRGSWFVDTNFRLPVVDNVGNLIEEVPKNVEFRFIKRESYYVLLKHNEVEEAKPSLALFARNMLQFK